MHAIVCVTVKVSRVILRKYNDGKMDEFKDSNDFQNFVCISNRLVVERLQLYCELLENITLCVSFNLTFRRKKTC